MASSFLQELAQGNTAFLDPQLVSPTYDSANSQIEGAFGGEGLLAEKGKAAQAEQNPEPGIKSITQTFDAKGGSRVKIDASAALAQQFQELAQSGYHANQAIEGLVARLRERQRVQEEHPIISQLGRVASLAAASYQAPNSRLAPLVKAAGVYGGDYFRDTPDQLQGQIAEAEQQKLKNLLPIYEAKATQERQRILDEQFNRKQANDDAMLKIAKDREVRQEMDDLYKGYEIGAQKGIYAPGTFETEAQAMVDAGKITPAQVKAKAIALEATNEQFYAKQAQDLADKMEQRQWESNLARSTALYKHNLERGDREAAKAVDQVRGIDEKIVAAYGAQQSARTYFAAIAAQLSTPDKKVPPPKNAQEAQALLAEYVKDPMRAQQAPEIVSKAASLIDNFDMSAQLTQLKTQREAYTRKLAPEDAFLKTSVPKSSLAIQFEKVNGRAPTPAEEEALIRGYVEPLINNPPPPVEEGGILAKAKKILDAYELTPKARRILASLPPIEAAKSIMESGKSLSEFRFGTGKNKKGAQELKQFLEMLQTGTPDYSKIDAFFNEVSSRVEGAAGGASARADAYLYGK